MVTLAKNETNNPYNVRYFFVCARSSCLLLRIEELLAKKHIYIMRGFKRVSHPYDSQNEKQPKCVKRLKVATWQVGSPMTYWKVIQGNDSFKFRCKLSRSSSSNAIYVITSTISQFLSFPKCLNRWVSFRAYYLYTIF